MQTQMAQNQIASQAQSNQMRLASNAQQQSMAQNEAVMAGMQSDRLRSVAAQEAAFGTMAPIVGDINPAFGGLSTVATSMLGDTSTPTTARKTLLGN